jgi:hypothetical protein
VTNTAVGDYNVKIVILMKTILFALTSFVIVACHNGEEILSQAKIPSVAKMMSPPPVLEMMPERAVDQKFIREATLLFEVGNVALVYDSIKNLLPGLQAYTASERQTSDAFSLEQNMEIRVREENFDRLVARIISYATVVKTKTVDAEDVTASYIDTQARLKTKKELEARYHEILKQARTVKDILAIEEQIGSVREEIESMESRMTYLRDKTSFSTVKITFSERLADDPGFGDKVAGAVNNGWHSLIVFLLSLLSLWPVLVGVSGTLVIIIRYWKRKQRALAAS